MLADTASIELVRVIQIQITAVIQEAAKCYQTQVLDCMNEKMGNCTQEYLLAFSECLVITGRHLNIEFNSQEKNVSTSFRNSGI